MPGILRFLTGRRTAIGESEIKGGEVGSTSEYRGDDTNRAAVRDTGAGRGGLVSSLFRFPPGPLSPPGDGLLRERDGPGLGC